ncbi:hypothetical protein G5C51_37405 [Streptomyces sp. A7024]|uniref:Uncharacterized protein n=1 Tax=Streptomyces coryli TaxID=1128680 RepID=A0A6G4UE68_9ACTN|nr:hypothetical protein [Streptomyces coryli]
MAVVFLYVAPANGVSKTHKPVIDGWIYPWFEQHWALFAPNPFAANYRIEARTSASGTWHDLSAVDNAAVRHSPYPARANQNLLRRAWKIYRDFGDRAVPARTERAELFRRYLGNIAAGRLEGLGERRGTYDALQLRITTLPIPAPGAASAPRPTRTVLPWWRA